MNQIKAGELQKIATTFRRLNPDCCKIVTHDPVWVGFRDHLFGSAAKSVHLHYIVSYINELAGVSQMEGRSAPSPAADAS